MKSQHSPINLIEKKLNEIGVEGYVVLDFDHTLFLGNSTELFIAGSYFRPWVKFVDYLSKIFWHKFSKRIPLELDQFRILLITFFAPYVWLSWKKNVSRHADYFWNNELWNIVSLKSKNIIIVSYGFKSLIAPIILHKLSVCFTDYTLIASNLFHKNKSLRSIGKVVAVQNVCESINWGEVLSVSDSIDDLPLLEKSAVGVMADWDEPVLNKILYFPFRYLEKVKFPHASYLKKNILGEDLFVWLLLFSIDTHAIIPAVILFFSFQIIYEIGYFENDFFGAKKEDYPQLSEKYKLYMYYPIYSNAWFVAIILMLFANLLFANSLDFNFIGKWLLVLLTLRIIFHIYNNLKPNDRFQYYAILQAMKYFSGVIVFFSNAVGVVFALSIFFSKCMIYFVYRSKGNKNLLPITRIKTTLFFLGVLILWLMGVDINLYICAISILWVLYQEGVLIFVKYKESILQLKFMAAIYQLRNRFLRR